MTGMGVGVGKGGGAVLTSAGVGDIAPGDAGAEVHAVSKSRATCAIVARPELSRAGARLIIPP
jgi:hypothetical protein